MSWHLLHGNSVWETSVLLRIVRTPWQTSTGYLSSSLIGSSVRHAPSSNFGRLFTGSATIALFDTYFAQIRSVPMYDFYKMSHLAC